MLASWCWPMVDTSALFNLAEGRIENLEGDRAWISENDSVKLEYLKLQAMLLQADELARIREALEGLRATLRNTI